MFDILHASQIRMYTTGLSKHFLKKKTHKAICKYLGLGGSYSLCLKSALPM